MLGNLSESQKAQSWYSKLDEDDRQRVLDITVKLPDTSKKKIKSFEYCDGCNIRACSPENCIRYLELQANRRCVQHRYCSLKCAFQRDDRLKNDITVMKEVSINYNLD